MKILVSACLLGHNTKYNGRNNLCELVKNLAQKHELIPICPEVDGGLSIPRTPAEIQESRVINKEGIDVTSFYQKGASIALKTALDNNIKYAILKEKSPSCGVKYIYDGSFNGKLKEDSGITTRLLKEHHIEVYSELEINKLIEKLEKI